MLPKTGRIIATAIAEALVFFFFIVLAWTGIEVVDVLGGSNLTSLPWVPLSFTQSAIPIGAVLFIIAEALRLPEAFRMAIEGEIQDTELREIMEGAEVTEARLKGTGA
jgi:TRAP-type C4-dicarboxylate transport system permease small subunit